MGKRCIAVLLAGVMFGSMAAWAEETATPEAEETLPVEEAGPVEAEEAAPAEAEETAPVGETPKRGGLAGFFVGCCFGPRTAAAYNEGKTIHWREWAPYVGVASGPVSFVPIVGQFASLGLGVASFVFAVINGIDGAEGKTSADYAEQFGAQYY